MGAKETISATRPAAYPAAADWSRLLIACGLRDYSASLLARAVEDCDAQVLNLNVCTQDIDVSNLDTEDFTGDADKQAIKVELCVNHRNAENVSRSLERYGFTVLEAESSSDEDTDNAERNIAHLLNYLQI